MARKRKIPVRKHHGVRDPLQQIEQREKKLANVTNNPPTQKDEQRGSYNFQQFKKIADAAKAGKKVKMGVVGKEDIPKSALKRKAQESVIASNKRPSRVKQLANETDVDYLKRVNRITTATLKEAEYEAKYGVNIIRNPTTGQITVRKKPKNEIDELLKKKRKEQSLNKNKRKNAKAKVKIPMDDKTSKELIKRAIKETDQEVEAEKVLDSPAEYKRDVFKFGETVHAPPTLKTLPRKANKDETVPRPGRKSNLLLKSLMDDGEKAAPKETAKKSAVNKKQQQSTPTKRQLKGKRKDLPAATRNMLEGERSKMIDLYRQLKKNQNLNKPQA